MSEMNIFDRLIHTTIRIETSGPAGEGSGTGFFVNFHEHGEEKVVPVIVTNKHVVEGASSIRLRFTKKEESTDRPIFGDMIEIEITDKSAWVYHDDINVDLCAIPFAAIAEASKADGNPIFVKAFNIADIANQDFLESLVPIEDILMIGYPNGLWDSKNNLPITRRGVTATSPGIDFDGVAQFVIDCACFPGSSGSPILLYNPTTYFDKSSGSLMMGGRIKLIGILWGGPQFDSIGEIKVLPVPTSAHPISHAKIPMNLGYCIKSTELFYFDQAFARLLG